MTRNFVARLLTENHEPLVPIRREVGPESRDTETGQEVSVLAEQGVDVVPRIVRDVGLVEEHDPVIDPK